MLPAPNRKGGGGLYCPATYVQSAFSTFKTTFSPSSRSYLSFKESFLWKPVEDDKWMKQRPFYNEMLCLGPLFFWVVPRQGYLRDWPKGPGQSWNSSVSETLYCKLSATGDARKKEEGTSKLHLGGIVRSCTFTSWEFTKNCVREPYQDEEWKTVNCLPSCYCSSFHESLCSNTGISTNETHYTPPVLEVENIDFNVVILPTISQDTLVPSSSSFSITKRAIIFHTKNCNRTNENNKTIRVAYLLTQYKNSSLQQI